MSANDDKGTQTATANSGSVQRVVRLLDEDLRSHGLGGRVAAENLLAEFHRKNGRLSRSAIQRGWRLGYELAGVVLNCMASAGVGRRVTFDGVERTEEEKPNIVLDRTPKE